VEAPSQLAAAFKAGTYHKPGAEFTDISGPGKVTAYSLAIDTAPGAPAPTMASIAGILRNAAERLVYPADGIDQGNYQPDFAGTWTSEIEVPCGDEVAGIEPGMVTITVTDRFFQGCDDDPGEFEPEA
jgi:hypothetical protein